jgi:hypothetical protein
MLNRPVVLVFEFEDAGAGLSKTVMTDKCSFAYPTTLGSKQDVEHAAGLGAQLRYGRGHIAASRIALPRLFESLSNRPEHVAVAFVWVLMFTGQSPL